MLFVLYNILIFIVLIIIVFRLYLFDFSFSMLYVLFCLFVLLTLLGFPISIEFVFFYADDSRYSLFLYIVMICAFFHKTLLNCNCVVYCA